MPLDTLQAIATRHSVRRYAPAPLPAADLQAILEAGRQAPSAGNRQPWHMVVVQEEEQRRALAAACMGQSWLAGASAIIAGVGKPDVSEKWYRVDVAIALENMILAATALGYGTCWIGAFNQDQVRAVLGLPNTMEVVALTPLGRPAEQPEPRPRMPMGEFASLERYGVPAG